MNQHSQKQPNTITSQNNNRLKLTFLGGLADVGEKNMAIIEYGNDALVLDCGNNLGIDLPGVNYEINDLTYLKTIEHKLRGYVITHGHLDHMGGLKHTVPHCPAPIYGSRFTIGVIEKAFEDLPVKGRTDFKPQLMPIDIDTHERLTLGCFTVEFIRVTHSIPDPAAICIDTPVGRIIATGDFRLDPEPLDNLSTDIRRLQELGKEGVLVLLSESSYSDCEGRTPTEHTLQQSFHDVISKAEGRIFVSVFSSNMNRTQMIINEAVAAGRNVAFDGRSMLSYAEIAVRYGILKIPKGTIVAMREAINLPDRQVLILCTGGQGEPRAALQRMGVGSHRCIQLKSSDTVVISSSPIPGNERRYGQISDNITQIGARLFRHPTHELDGCGPLHVSGHARREELLEMFHLIKPKFFIPVHGGSLRRHYHANLAIEAGCPRSRILLPRNGDCLYLAADSIRYGGRMPHHSLLVDQSGQITSHVVVKDRRVLAAEGMLTVFLSIDSLTGQLLTNPDIISRGFIHMRENQALMQGLRQELQRAVRQRFKRVDIERFKAELRDYLARFLFEKTGQCPILIIVVTVLK
ncbi:MAG TPA: ribonuclease J [Candidatus Saccharimonadales bacterium]|nr:ribonuclease J [Candidatus Saccharimonadales bacterium]